MNMKTNVDIKKTNKQTKSKKMKKANLDHELHQLLWISCQWEKVFNFIVCYEFPELFVCCKPYLVSLMFWDENL